MNSASNQNRSETKAESLISGNNLQGWEKGADRHLPRVYILPRGPSYTVCITLTGDTLQEGIFNS